MEPSDFHPDDPARLEADEAEATIEGGPFADPEQELPNPLDPEAVSALTPEQQAKMTEFQDAYQKMLEENLAHRQHIAMTYGGAVLTNGEVAAIRVDTLVDFMLPKGSPSRLAFDMTFEVSMAGALAQFEQQCQQMRTSRAQRRSKKDTGKKIEVARSIPGIPDLRQQG
jgi:hypothetical protein